MIFKLVTFSAACLLTLYCFGQTPGTISEENIKSHIKTLASDEFQGRRPGTLGEEKTVNYLTTQLENLGIEPANGTSYFQEFTISRLIYEEPSGMTITTGNAKTTYLPSRDFYCKTSLKANEPVIVKNAEMVFAGFGIIAPEYNWNDYENLDVRDKIVIVMFSDPGFYTKDDSHFNGMSISPHAGIELKKKLAFERGAKGLIIIHNTFINWEMIGKSPSGKFSRSFIKGNHELISDGLMFSGMISIPMMETFMKDSGYSKDYVSLALSKEFQGLNLKSKLSVTNTSTTDEYLKTKNVLGILKGSKTPNEHIIYTAHWDHIGTRPSRFGKDSIFNGAIDNASGTAMHLEVARAFKNLKKKPQRSILFFFTSAEEMGLLGAEYYAENPLYPLKDAVCVINADGHFATNKMTTVTSILKGYSEMDKYVDNAAATINRNTVEDTSPSYLNIFQRSDHYPLVKKGVPAVWAMGNQNPVKGGQEEAQKVVDYMQRYHRVTDEYYEGFNAQNIAADAQLNFLIGYELANSNDWPNWNEDVEFKKVREKSLKK